MKPVTAWVIAAVIVVFALGVLSRHRAELRAQAENRVVLNASAVEAWCDKYPERIIRYVEHLDRVHVDAGTYLVVVWVRRGERSD